MTSRQRDPHGFERIQTSRPITPDFPPHLGWGEPFRAPPQAWFEGDPTRGQQTQLVVALMVPNDDDDVERYAAAAADAVRGAFIRRVAQR